MNIYLEHAARGQNAWWRYGLSLVVACALTVVLGLVTLFALELAGVPPIEAAGDPGDPASPIAFFASTAWIFALVLAALLIAVRLVQKKPPAAVFGAWSWRGWSAGFGVWLAAMVAMVLIDFALAPSGFSLTASSSTLLLFAAVLPTLAVQTFAEEVVFRGWMTQGLLLWLRRPLPAALISGVAFGALHIANGWPQAASATIFGVATAIIAIRTGGIAFVSGLHLANNLFGAVVVVNAHDAFRGAPGLFAQATPQLMWWDTVVGSLAIVVLAVVIGRRTDRAPAT